MPLSFVIARYFAYAFAAVATAWLASFMALSAAINAGFVYEASWGPANTREVAEGLARDGVCGQQDVPTAYRYLILNKDGHVLMTDLEGTRLEDATEMATGPAVAGAPEASLDRTSLARAAANLVANAAEHARSRVAVSCDVAGGRLVIEVADDGPGFSPAALERGCERLFTDDSSRSSRDGGRYYGLGLHAASEAASAHGGSVSLANSPSGGAVATIAVPLCGA